MNLKNFTRDEPTIPARNTPLELVKGDDKKRSLTGPLYLQMERAVTIVDSDQRILEFSCASEYEVDRRIFIEVLQVKTSAVRLKRLKDGSPFLVNHNHNDQVGVIVRAWIEASDKTVRVQVKFGRSVRATEIYNDIIDGIRKKVSIGYWVHDAILSEVRDGVEVIHITDWEPYEVSTVPLPADPSVGMGRSGVLKDDPLAVGNLPDGNEPETNNQNGENQPMLKRLLQKSGNFRHDPDSGAPAGGAPSTPAPAAPAAPTTPASDNSATRAAVVSEGVNTERNRVKEIQALATRAGVPEEASRAIESGETVDAFRTRMFERAYPKATPAVQPASIGMNDKEIKRYSIVRAIASLSKKDGVLTGLEKEASDQVAKNCRREANGFFIPSDIQHYRDPNIRALSAEVLTKGGYLVQENVLSSSMIELLRNQQLVAQMGARMLDGLVGNVAIPKQTGGATAYWLGEDEEVPDSDQAFGQLTLVPHRLAALTKFSKQLLVQTSPSVEALVRSDLMTVLALAKDLAALTGSGIDGQPQGIIGTTGVGSVTFGAAATWAKVVEFETAVATANALTGSPAYLTTPAVRGKWKTKLKDAATAGYLWETNGANVNGYRAEVTNQIPSDKVIFGNWNDLIIADWDGMDVVVDPFTLAQNNQVRIVMNLLSDIGIRHGASFAVSSDSGAQ